MVEYLVSVTVEVQAPQVPSGRAAAVAVAARARTDKNFMLESFRLICLERETERVLVLSE